MICVSLVEEPYFGALLGEFSRKEPALYCKKSCSYRGFRL